MPERIIGTWTLYGYDNGVPVYVFNNIKRAGAERLNRMMGLQDRAVCVRQPGRTIIIPEEAVKRYVWVLQYSRDGD